MPYVEKNYRVLTDRNNTAIAGLSMGGNHALQVGIPHLNRFAYIGVYSSGLLGAFPGLGRTARRSARAAAAPPPRQPRTARGPAAAAPPPRHRPRPPPNGRRNTRPQLDNANLKKGLKVFWFATGKDDVLHHDDQRDGRALQEARLQPGLQGDGRRPHVDQLARLPERVRADAVPVGSDLPPEGGSHCVCAARRSTRARQVDQQRPRLSPSANARGDRALKKEGQMQRVSYWVAAAILAVASVSAQTPAGQPPAGQAPAPPVPQGRGGGRGGPPVVSPEVNADKSVTLRFRAPNAKEVTLIGELDGKTYPMTKNENGDLGSEDRPARARRLQLPVQRRRHRHDGPDESIGQARIRRVPAGEHVRDPRRRVRRCA